MYANVNESTVLYLKSYRCMGLQGGYAREVCKGVCNGCAMGVQWVCKGCYLTPSWKKLWGGSGQHFAQVLVHSVARKACC